MNRREQVQFIDEELKGLWPQWCPTEAELRLWMADLESLEYGVARAAAAACFRDAKTSDRRPNLGRFLDRARALSRPASGQSKSRVRDLETNVFIECLEPPVNKPHLAGVRKGVFVAPRARQSDPAYVSACAESMARRVAQIHGGHWIVVQTAAKQLSPSA